MLPRATGIHAGQVREAVNHLVLLTKKKKKKCERLNMSHGFMDIDMCLDPDIIIAILDFTLACYAGPLCECVIWNRSFPIKCLVLLCLFQTFPSIWFGLTVQGHFQYLLMVIEYLFPLPPTYTHWQLDINNWSKQTWRVVEGAELQLGNE